MIDTHMTDLGNRVFVLDRDQPTVAVDISWNLRNFPASSRSFAFDVIIGHELQTLQGTACHVLFWQVGTHQWDIWKLARKMAKMHFCSG